MSTPHQVYAPQPRATPRPRHPEPPWLQPPGGPGARGPGRGGSHQTEPRQPEFRPARPARTGRPHQGGYLPQALAILLLLGGIGGYLGGTQAVRLVDDGKARTVRTYANTVKGLLHHAGVRLGAHDVVRPAPGRALRDGATVQVARGRPVTLTVDGRTRVRWVVTRTVRELVAGLDLGDAKLRVSAPADRMIPRTGMRLVVRTEKHLTLRHDGRKKTLTTYAGTSAELLAEQGLRLEGRDQVEPAPKASLAGVDTVRLYRVTVKSKEETVPVDPPVKLRKNHDWMLDQRQVVDAGKPGKARQRVEYLHRDGKFFKRVVLESTTLVEPEQATVRQGTKKYPPDDTGLNWDALAECESGGNPESVSANGMYHGLYQFNVDMWHRMGGIGLPSEATPREQTYRAILLYKRAGDDQWPHCGSRLYS